LAAALLAATAAGAEQQEQSIKNVAGMAARATLICCAFMPNAVGVVALETSATAQQQLPQ
jgi:hypothetical protein